LDDLYDKTGEVNGEKGPQPEKQPVTGDKQSPVEPDQGKGEALPVDLQELQEKHLRLRAEYDNHAAGPGRPQTDRRPRTAGR
jgi:hypothetical protein